MTWQDLLFACLLISAILGAGAALVKAARWAGSSARKWVRVADDWLGEEPRPGLPDGRPGMFERLSSIEVGVVDRLDRVDDRLDRVEQRLAAVELQLQPNGGHSLRDAVDRLTPPAEPAA